MTFLRWPTKLSPWVEQTHYSRRRHRRHRRNAKALAVRHLLQCTGRGGGSGIETAAAAAAAGYIRSLIVSGENAPPQSPRRRSWSCYARCTTSTMSQLRPLPCWLKRLRCTAMIACLVTRMSGAEPRRLRLRSGGRRVLMARRVRLLPHRRSSVVWTAWCSAGYPPLGSTGCTGRLESTGAGGISCTHRMLRSASFVRFRTQSGMCFPPRKTTTRRAVR